MKLFGHNYLGDVVIMFIFAILNTVVLAQLVRAPDCGSGGRGFEPHIPPNLKAVPKRTAFLFISFSVSCVLDQTESVS